MGDASEPPTRKKTKSSLVSHMFPTFYACYLLKSMKSPKSITTYIGSTPHPPRRIRQHNGELSQGAWKTSRGRPWVMTMIVYGFPSKLAALQFEWAWQHPDLSRHLRGKEIAKGRSLKQNIMVAYSMLTSQHYSSWPLHVKLFTPEAVKHWEAICKPESNSLPLGLTFAIELEGVDGKSGQVGTGRAGPIDVTDAKFTSELLSKHHRMLAVSKLCRCVVCSVEIDIGSADPLSTALCPNSNCIAYAHLTCLSSSFLASNGQGTTLIPRGGRCTACKEYVLWGDIIRGCYRRFSASTKENGGGEDGADTEKPGSIPVNKRSKKPLRTRVRPPKPPSVSSEDGEVFDIDDISSDSVSISHPDKNTGRLSKVQTPDDTESICSVTSSPLKKRGQKSVISLQRKFIPMPFEDGRETSPDDESFEDMFRVGRRTEGLSMFAGISDSTRPCSTQDPLCFTPTQHTPPDGTVLDVDDFSSESECQEIIVGMNNCTVKDGGTLRGSTKPFSDPDRVDLEHDTTVIEISD